MVKQTNGFDKKLGEKIAKYRTALKLSRKDLADKIGITHQQLQKYEKGVNRVSVSRLIDICKLLKIKPSVLIEECSVEVPDNHNSKLVKEIVSYVNLISDKEKLTAVKNVVKSMV